MTIRPATIEDLPKLAPLAAQFYASSRFLRNFDIERFVQLWTSLIGNGTGVIFLLCEDGKIQGTIGGVAYSETYSDALIATEFFLYVDNRARGGTSMLRLYRAFENWAREKSCSQIRLAHLQDSMPERLGRVYVSMGFVPTETLYSKELR